MRVLLIIIVVGCGACKEKAHKQPAKAEPTAESTAITAPPKSDGTSTAVAAADAAVAAPVEIKTDLPYDVKTLCESRCLLLAEHSYESLSRGKHAELCGGIGDAPPWPGINAENCDQYDVLRNCIFAAHGYLFKKKKYQQHFGQTSWYKPDPSFKQSKLSSVARANVNQLLSAASKCRAGGEAGAATGDAVTQVRGDLDGDGTPEAVVITQTHVSVAGHRVAHRIDFASEDIYSESLQARVVDLDRNDKTKELVLSFSEVTDATQYLIYALEGGSPVLIGEMDGFFSAEFPGDGSITGEFANCGQTTTNVWRRVGGRFKVVSEKTTGTHDPTQCAACPYVYVGLGEHRRFAGEILRRLNSKELEGRQELAIYARPVRGVIDVRVSEEKKETTYLDAIHLEVGGQEVRPESCADARARYCRVDNDYLVLESGQHLDLRFAVPESVDASHVRVVASGFFVPHP